MIHMYIYNIYTYIYIIINVFLVIHIYIYYPYYIYVFMYECVNFEMIINKKYWNRSEWIIFVVEILNSMKKIFQ